MQLRNFIFLMVVVFVPSPSRCCSNVGKNAGESAARELKEAIIHASNTLSNAMGKSVSELKEITTSMGQGISDLADSVDIRINSGDLANIGDKATRNIRDALVELSKNWELAVKTADIRDMGIEVSKHLSEAIQNVNVKLAIYIDAGPGMVEIAKYISIAVGVSFSVLFVAIVITCIYKEGLCCKFQNVSMNCCARRNSGDVERNTEPDKEKSTTKGERKQFLQRPGKLDDTSEKDDDSDTDPNHDDKRDSLHGTFKNINFALIIILNDTVELLFSHGHFF